MEAKPEIIALDATISSLKGTKLDEFFRDQRKISRSTIGRLSTIEEALHADELGILFIEQQWLATK